MTSQSCLSFSKPYIRGSYVDLVSFANDSIEFSVSENNIIFTQAPKSEKQDWNKLTVCMRNPFTDLKNKVEHTVESTTNNATQAID